MTRSIQPDEVLDPRPQRVRLSGRDWCGIVGVAVMAVGMTCGAAWRVGVAAAKASASAAASQAKITTDIHHLQADLSLLRDELRELRAQTPRP